MKFNITICILIYSNLFLSQAPPILQAKNGVISIERVEALNSSYQETNLSVTPNNKHIFFMTCRGNSEWSMEGYNNHDNKSEYDSDVWMSSNINGIWLAPKALNLPINSSQNEDEPVVSQDGQNVYYQSWSSGWRTKGGPYYESLLDGRTWKIPKGLGDGINQFFVDSMDILNSYATDGMSISPDKKTFLVAAGEDYNGKMDLLFSNYKNGQWSYLKKHSISTPGNERSVFIADDGKSVYFASDGYGGAGGLDIFKAKLASDGSITHIVNIGAPFNTPQNDYGFVVTNHGEEAYFIRDNDIYHASLNNADSLIKPNKTIWISGLTTDQNGISVGTEIKLKRDDGSTYTSINSNALDGSYFVSVPEEGHIKFVEIDGIETELKLEENKTEYKIDLKATTKTHHIVHFDYDDFEITSNENQLLAKFLNEVQLHDNAKVILIGHTDVRGSSKYNNALSKKRAASVKRYFEKKGINQKRISIKYYGKSQPLTKEETENGHWSNRRVEILTK